MKIKKAAWQQSFLFNENAGFVKNPIKNAGK